jgi:hypothetical protein
MVPSIRFASRRVKDDAAYEPTRLRERLLRRMTEDAAMLALLSDLCFAIYGALITIIRPTNGRRAADVRCHAMSAQRFHVIIDCAA